MENQVFQLRRNPEKLWTTEQTAQYFSVSKITLYRWIKRGYIKAVHISRRLRIPESEIMRLSEETINKLKNS